MEGRHSESNAQAGIATPIDTRPSWSERDHPAHRHKPHLPSQVMTCLGTGASFLHHCRRTVRDLERSTTRNQLARPEPINASTLSRVNAPAPRVFTESNLQVIKNRRIDLIKSPWRANSDADQHRRFRPRVGAGEPFPLPGSLRHDQNMRGAVLDLVLQPGLLAQALFVQRGADCQEFVISQGLGGLHYNRQRHVPR